MNKNSELFYVENGKREDSKIWEAMEKGASFSYANSVALSKMLELGVDETTAREMLGIPEKVRVTRPSTATNPADDPDEKPRL